MFFSETSTSHAATSFVSTHTHTHTHTITNTLTLSHTHMTGKPWLVGQVVPEEFLSGFAKFFGPTRGQQEFFGPPGGHATYENIPQRVNCFFYLC